MRTAQVLYSHIYLIKDLFLSREQIQKTNQAPNVCLLIRKDGFLVRHTIMYLFNALCQVLLPNDVQRLS